jgi:bis(5'-nucleosyl)-tetraphosphatase (symmetrical)
MTARRTLVIGDVHGCLLELQDLLRSLNYRKEDRLIFVGDLIHKGPDSKGVLDLVQSLNAECVVGNHELRFMKSCAQNGNENAETLRVKAQLGSELQTCLNWMKRLPAFIESDDFVVVHAGLLPGIHPSESKSEDLATIRTWDGLGKNLQNPSNPPWFDFYDGQKTVIFGHWAKMGLVLRDNVVGLDTGCVYGKQLSAWIVEERRLVQVQARRAYVSIQAEV